jgi:O-antigen/teichoic acid export membrane protein
LIGIFQGEKEYGLINILSIINGILSTVLFSLLYFTDFLVFFSQKIDNVFLYSFILLVLNTSFLMFFYIKKIFVSPNLKINKKDFKLFFTYIGVGHLSNIINFFNYRLDIWFVSYYNGIAQLGFYSLAVSISQMLLMISNPISSVLFPYLSEQEKENNKINMFAFFSRINTFLILILSIVFFFLGKYFIPLLYGAEFIGSLEVFKIMVIATFFMGITKVIATYIASVNKIKYNLFATIIGFVITLLLNLILIPRYGIIGAAVSSLLAYLSILLFVYCKVRKITGNINLNLFIIKEKDIAYIKQLKNEKR